MSLSRAENDEIQVAAKNLKNRMGYRLKFEIAEEKLKQIISDNTKEQSEPSVNWFYKLRPPWAE
ncbi:MAG: hypothetical protein DME18_11815 [Verrucomicrobia bacterium]|nr:MAG: hypothetical protein DME18_11815 [Verrucomicrobiota bacterium]